MASFGLLRERIGPAAFGAIILAGSIALHKLGYGLPSGDSFLESLVSLGGILAGFLATMKTLLLAMREQTMEKLRSSGYIHDLRWYLSEALWGSLFLCVVALVGFSTHLHGSPYLYAVLLGLLAHALASLHRVTRIGTSLLLQRSKK